MKKIFIFAAAVATLAACQKNSPVELVNDAADNNAIGFSAYTGTAVTKGTVVATDDITGLNKAGIGVFAFYQPATNGVANNFNSTKYATPDFMYNQQVNCKTTASKFEYSPLKYWPNNEKDQVSFFAYAPYKANTTWEDLGFSTDINATKLTATFPVYSEKTAMVDYVFAKPALNKSKQKVAATSGEPSADLITFSFKHIMSRVAIQIGAIVDKKPAATPEKWTDSNTKITVESLELKGIAESYDYTYTIEGASETWKENGSQDLVLTATDFQNNTSTKWDAADWKPLLAKEKEGEVEKDGYLFIAPQDLTNAELVITYTVATTDESNPANNSTITNVITKEIGVDFETGKAYTLNLLIGMKTVELSAAVVEWSEVTPVTQIDVPANTPAEP